MHSVGQRGFTDLCVGACSSATSSAGCHFPVLFQLDTSPVALQVSSIPLPCPQTCPQRETCMRSSPSKSPVSTPTPLVFKNRWT